MRKEIDILQRALSKGFLVVNKESHVLLDDENWLSAQQSPLYQKECDLLAPEKQAELSGPFPGCMQLGGATRGSDYRMLGQTAHFAIFYPAEGEGPPPNLECRA